MSDFIILHWNMAFLITVLKKKITYLLETEEQDAIVNTGGDKIVRMFGIKKRVERKVASFSWFWDSGKYVCRKSVKW